VTNRAIVAEIEILGGPIKERASGAKKKRARGGRGAESYWEKGPFKQPEMEEIVLT